MAYPFMLTKEQKKGVSSGLSFYAISQLMIALFIVVLWVRSIFGSFQKFSAKPNMGISFPTVSSDIISKEIQTPTATPWTVLGSNNTQTVLNTPTIVPVVLTDTPSPTPTIQPTETQIPITNIPNVPGAEFGPSWTPDEIAQVKVSYYWPPLGGINCDLVNGNEECNLMANGEYVKDNVGTALACPSKFPFGTQFLFGGRYYVCKDRGSDIVDLGGGVYWVDILYPHMPYDLYWGEQIPAQIWLPK